MTPPIAPPTAERASGRQALGACGLFRVICTYGLIVSPFDLVGWTSRL